MSSYERVTETVTVPNSGSEWVYQGKEVTVLGVYVKWQYKNPEDRQRTNPLPAAELKCFKYGGAGGFTPVEPRYEVGKTYEMNSVFPKAQTFTFEVFHVDEEKAYGVATINGMRDAMDALHEHFSKRVVGEI